MQSALIQRYLGNKNLISPKIMEVIRDFVAPGDLVFDAFSGSLAVSAAFRAADLEVACNDINLFSWVYARAYFSTSSIPPIALGDRVYEPQPKSWEDLTAILTAPYDQHLPEYARRTDIFDHYCEEGPKSAFLSGRGKSGRRRFFTAENARLIDRALSRIRHWHKNDVVNELTRGILTAALLSAVEKVSNTQGTFHDFPRAFVDQRALKKLRIRPPTPELFGGRPSRFIGKAEDSLDFAQKVPAHKVLYLDPPYNFRQYTSYYFMLNMLSCYAELLDLDRYFGDIKYVRGQNMSDDFSSTFCKKNHFLPSLRKLVETARTDYVVLSYFDGRNHWGEFKSSISETEGRRLLSEFFTSDLFVEGSFQCFPIERLNYQSYGGHKARQIQEFIFVAQKRIQREAEETVRGNKWIGQALV